MSNPFSLALTLHPSKADYTPPRVTSTTLEWHRRVMDVGTPRISRDRQTQCLLIIRSFCSIAGLSSVNSDASP